MEAMKNRKKNIIKAANVFADFSLEGFCWFIFHQSKVPQDLLNRKKEK